MTDTTGLEAVEAVLAAAGVSEIVRASESGPEPDTALTIWIGGPKDQFMAPLKFAHAAGVQVSGTSITLARALTKAHDSGAQVAGNVPTPGAPNQYSRRRQ